MWLPAEGTQAGPSLAGPGPLDGGSQARSSKAVLPGVGHVRGDLGSWGPRVGMTVGLSQGPALPPAGPGVLPSLCPVYEGAPGAHLARTATCRWLVGGRAAGSDGEGV